MDIAKLVQGVLGSQGSSAGGQLGALGSKLPGGLAGGAAAGGLISLLAGSKKGRKIGKKALTYGGIAVVGGLAWNAYRNWQSQSPDQSADQSRAPARGPASTGAPRALPLPEAGSAFDVTRDHDAQGQDLRLVLLRAMIAAANCDDHIDRDEHRRIRAQVESFDLGPEEKAALYDYFSAPSDTASIAALARTEEQKAEIYLASALCIDPDTALEEAYLAELAQRLKLPDGLRGYLDAEADAAREANLA